MFSAPFLLSVVAFVALAVATPTNLTPSLLQKRSISQDLLDDFVRYTKYSSGAYQLVCPRPLGNTLVVQVKAFSYELCMSQAKLSTGQFSDLVTNTQGFIARDDNRKEIVVAYRGSLQLQDFLTGDNSYFC